MIRAGLAMAVLLSTSIVIAGPQLAHAQSKRNVEDPTGWSVSGGIGANASPGQFLFQLDAPYRFSKLLSIGPTFQVGAGNNITTVSLSADGKVHLDLFKNASGGFQNFTPYAGIGIGFTHYSAGGFNETNFLLPIIMGLEFDLTERIALTNEMRFNVVPPSDAETFYWSWQLIGARYRF